MDKLFKLLLSEIQILRNQKRYSEALYTLELIATEAMNQMSIIYMDDVKSMDAARKILEIAVQFNPSSWVLHGNLCHNYDLARRYEEALVECEKSIQYNPGIDAECLYNLGVIKANLGDHIGAIDAYNRCIEVNPDHARAHYNMSASYLIKKDFKNGWEQYEWRFKAFDKPKEALDRFSQPYLTKTKLNKKSVYIFSEQGVGDLIQFCRYIKHLDGYKILECQESIADFMQRNNIANEIIPRSDSFWPTPKKTDYVVSVCSLPHLFTDMPIDNSVYLKSTMPKKILDGACKVGICWKGNKDYQYDYRRSCEFDYFKSLFSIPNVRVYSLQKDYYEHESLVSYNYESFTETAQMIDSLDLIISVDTAVAHLAAAMGKKVWLLVDKIGDWRWFETDEYSLWYPDMKVFRGWNNTILVEQFHQFLEDFLDENIAN